MPESMTEMADEAMEGTTSSRDGHTTQARAAQKLLKALGEAAPAPSGLSGVEWAALDSVQLGGLLREAYRPIYSPQWLGLEDGGWVRDAFVITGTQAWRLGALKSRFAHARFSPSVSLRAACQDTLGRLSFREAKFWLSTKAGQSLVDRVNADCWTPREVLDEAHGLYTGSLVCSPILAKAGAGALGEVMVATLKAHRNRTLELLNGDLDYLTVDWVD